MSIATAALEAASGIDRFTEASTTSATGCGRSAGSPMPSARSTTKTTTKELILVDGRILAFDDEDDDATGELVLDDDVETVRSEAARLTTQLEGAARRMAALEARRAALIRRLEDSGR